MLVKPGQVLACRSYPAMPDRITQTDPVTAGFLPQFPCLGPPNHLASLFSAPTGVGQLAAGFQAPFASAAGGSPSLVCHVNDLVALLANADMNAILADFGKRTAREDPVIHSYETFLAACDPKLREMRGVYDTPTPVASHIVRSLDYLLRTRFKCPGGLADSTQIEISNPAPMPSGLSRVKPPKTIRVHKVLLLDPATGTATFPYAVVDHIRGVQP